MSDTNGQVVRIDRLERDYEKLDSKTEKLDSRQDTLTERFFELSSDVRAIRKDGQKVQEDVADIKRTIEAAAKGKVETSVREKLAIISVTGVIIAAVIQAVAQLGGG